MVQAFTELMAEKSFGDISVQDISERAGVNRSTFYAHFEDKFALIDTVARDKFRTVVLGEIVEPTPLDLHSLGLLLVGTLKAFSMIQAKPGGKKTAKSAYYILAREELNAIMFDWLAPVQTAHGITREMAAVFYSWAIYGVAREWSESDQVLSADEVAASLLSLIADGYGDLTHPK